MTHKQRVLQLLSDNEPHSHMEGYRLGVMLHSRVADLRRDGYTIKCWHEKDKWLYQLFGTVQKPGQVPVTGGTDRDHPASSLSHELVAGDGHGASAGSSTEQSPTTQLTVWEAA
jgi:hypothetical protein